jgi:hypothetical protein
MLRDQLLFLMVFSSPISFTNGSDYCLGIADLALMSAMIAFTQPGHELSRHRPGVPSPSLKSPNLPPVQIRAADLPALTVQSQNARCHFKQTPRPVNGESAISRLTRN